MMTSDKPYCPDPVTVDVQPLIIISARRPRHVSAAQNVGVEMVDGLAGIGTGIDDHPIAPVQPFLPGYVSRQCENLAQSGRIGRMGQRDDVLPGNYQHVYRRLRIQVPKRDRHVVLGDQRGGNLAADNLAENTVCGIIGHENYRSDMRFASSNARATATPATAAVSNRSVEWPIDASRNPAA